MSAKEVDSYLAKIPEPARSNLIEVRRRILEVIPEAEQVISYGFPGFKLDGKVICGIDAFKNHCSFFPHSSLVIPELYEELKGYETSAGTLRFPSDKPLPKALIRKLIRVRLAKIAEAKAGKKS
ncbi:MAG: iron chaperone [Actinomycetota bacterium]